MGITIDGTLKTGVIKIVGPTTLGYTVGESFFTNLAATSTSASTGVYTGDVTYHAGTTTGKSPSTITLQNGGKEILIHIAPVGTTQSPDIILSKN